jgi:hypothetical protein
MKSRWSLQRLIGLPVKEQRYPVHRYFLFPVLGRPSPLFPSLHSYPLDFPYCSLSLSLSRLPQWSSGQSSWLQNQMSRVPLPALPDFLGSGLEWGPLSLMMITEELLKWKSSCSGLENRN